MNVSSGTVTSDVGASAAYSPRMIWVLRSLCACALGISGYLAWTAFNMADVYGCGGGEIIDCGHVLSSKWSKVLGIPVSVPAGGLYASLLVLLAFAPRQMTSSMSSWLWSTMTAGAFMAGLAALWFIGLQIFVLKHLCPYCMVVHSCGLIFAFLMLRSRMTTTTQKSLVAGFSAIGVAGMVILQMVTPAPENFETITYVVEEPATDGTTDSDVFAPLGEVFESPSEVTEVFEAPGEVFEAPALEQESAETKSAQSEQSKQPESSGESVKVDSSNPVAATVLSILPPRVLLLNDLLGAVSQQADEPAAQPAADAATSDEPVKSDEQKTEASKSDQEDGDEPVAAEVTESDAGESNAKATSEPAKPAAPERRVITVAGNRVTLDVQQWPLLGKPDARYVFVEMFDYTCPHCRSTHQAIKGAFAKYGNSLAILALPVPLEPQCNRFAKGGGHAGACELAKIAVTVWRVSPAKFHEFPDWLFEANRPASVAKAHAEKLVGAEAFRKEYGSDIPNQYIKRHVDMYEKVGQGAVPKLLFPKSTINGVISSTTTLTNTIERELK